MNKFGISLIIGTLSLLALANPCWAWPPTYGIEFNFSSAKLKALMEHSGMRAGKGEMDAAHDFAVAIMNKCLPDCSVEFHNGKWAGTGSEMKFTFKNGFWFNVSWDPGVVEIQTKPATLDEIQTNAELMNKYIFDVAKAKELTGTTEAAHFNIGALSAFKETPDGFLRFFADYAGVPELAAGGFGYDFKNAPPFAYMSDGPKRALIHLIHQTATAKETSVYDIAQGLLHDIYTESPGFNDDQNRHYQAMGLKALDKRGFPDKNDAPVELRSIKMPESGEDFALLAELFEGRMKFLVDEKGPILFTPKAPNFFLTHEQIASRLYIYVTEAHLDWNRFKQLAMPGVQNAKLDSFVTGTAKWSNPADVRVLKGYENDVLSSQWIGDRMFHFLSTPEGAKSSDAHAIVDHLANNTANFSPEHKGAAIEFLKALYQTPTWQRDPSLQSTIARLEIEVVADLKTRVEAEAAVAAKAKADEEAHSRDVAKEMKKREDAWLAEVQRSERNEMIAERGRALGKSVLKVLDCVEKHTKEFLNKMN